MLQRMLKTIEDLLSKYERGGITRRGLVASLSALAVGSATSRAQSAPAPIRVRSLNHVSISVADVNRSVAFYQSMFGMTVKSREGTEGNPVAGGGGLVVNLAPGAGPEFLGIYHADKHDIGHFCLGVENFNAEETLKALTDRGVKARMRTRGESKEIFLTDPDDISVQLTDTSYCGGTGLRGNKCSA
jgi:catechol 2,3-dioxygenase-like lactoylglutathione lyase family enzyme